jgi:hypothetical protein
MVSGPIFMFCATRLVCMFCAPVLVFNGTEGVGSSFHVLRSQSSLRRYRGLRVPFSCFALPDSLGAVPRASGTIFMFCAPGVVFDGTEDVGSRLHVLRSRIRFRRYLGRQVPFSCFTLPDSFWAKLRASGPVFMFCARRLIFGCTEGAGYHFHVLRSWTRFGRYRGRPVQFSYFALPDSLGAVPRVSGPIFMFCAPLLVFTLPRMSRPVCLFCNSRTHFRRY